METREEEGGLLSSGTGKHTDTDTHTHTHTQTDTDRHTRFKSLE